MATRIVVFAAALSLSGALRAPAQIPSTDSLRIVLARATYFFEGVVQQWNVAADPAITPTPNTGIVRATRVLACPADVGKFENEDVTIQTDVLLPVGTRAWFLGVGWVVGRHVSTRVTATIQGVTIDRGDSVAVRYEQAITLGKAASVQAAAEAADLIVLATVMSEQPGNGAVHVTEKTQRWEIVTLRTDSVRGYVNTTPNDTVPHWVMGWTGPPPGISSSRVLMPLDAVMNTTYDTPTIPINSQRLFFLSAIRDRPSLRAVDSLATAFAANDVDIHPVSDAAYLGNATAGQLFGTALAHLCGQPVR